MRFFAGDGELALLAARCPDIACAYAMAGAQLTQGCQSTKHRKCGRWRSKVTGLNHTGTGLMLSMLALGEVEMEPFSDGTEDAPLLWRRLGSQTWVGFQCAHPHVTAAILLTTSSKSRSHVSKGRRNPTTFSAFLSRSLGCSPPQLKASRSLVLE